MSAHPSAFPIVPKPENAGPGESSLDPQLASAYQPRRVWGAVFSITWNLLLAFLFLFTGLAVRLAQLLTHHDSPNQNPEFSWIAPTYFAIMFAGWALLNFPLEFWFGYLEERQFGLAKDGVRAWTRDWLIGTIQHGVMFMIGACLLIIFQIVSPTLWLPLISFILLVLFLGSTYLSSDLIPLGLFNLQIADPATEKRLRDLLSPSQLHLKLPPFMVYSHPSLREYAGGIVGLANRQVYLMSRSTLSSASDNLLNFVMLHDLGHKRYHHNLLSALTGWAWIVMGLCASHWIIPATLGANATPTFGQPVYFACLALSMSLWMALGEPFLAYLGRRLEYQADRFYLRNGGDIHRLHDALMELSVRNLARTEALRRRETIFHPLPSVANRLHAARQFARTLASEQQD